MNKFLLLLTLVIELFAFANRGGGPLLSHLFLAGVTFLILAYIFFAEKRSVESTVATPAIKQTIALPHIFYWLFFIVFAVSFSVSKTPEFGLNELLLFANAGLLLFVFSSLHLREKDLHFFGVGLVAVAVIDTLLGFFIYTTTPFPRLAGTFLNLAQPYTSFANDFANFLLLVLPISFWFLLQKYQRSLSAVLSAGAFGILLSGFLLTFSRAALLSLIFTAVIGGVFFLVAQSAAGRKHVFSLLLRIGSALLCCLIIVNVLQFTRSRTHQTASLGGKLTFSSDEKAASVSERVEFWKGAVSLIKENPFLGTGVLSFKFLYPQHQNVFGIVWDHPHNMLLKLGVENGLVAAGLFLLFLLSALFFAVKFLWKNFTHPVFFFAIGAVASFTHNLLDFNYIVGNFVLFIAFIGIALSFSSEQAITPATRKFPYAYGLIAALLLSTVVVLIGIHEAYYNRDYKKGRAYLAEGNHAAAVYHLERAQRLFFKRELVGYLQEAYQKGRYNPGEDPDEETWAEKRLHLLEEEVARGSVDAHMYSLLADDYSLQKLEKAKVLYKRAVDLDPMNTFKYYFDYLVLFQKDTAEILPLQKRVLELLKEYKVALVENRHLTVLGDNAQYAARLYRWFGMEQEAKYIEEKADEEYLKFINLYGTPQN